MGLLRVPLARPRWIRKDRRKQLASGHEFGKVANDATSVGRSAGLGLVTVSCQE